MEDATKKDNIKLHSVLVIDDNESFLELLKIHLDKTDIQVDYATPISEAKNFFNKRYDVIAADYNLGYGVTGYDTIKLYKERFPSTKTILYTGGNIADNHTFDVDKIVYYKDINELIEYIKLYCANSTESNIVAIYSEIDKIKIHLLYLQKVVDSVNEIKSSFVTINNKVNDFIDSHRNDFYKILIALFAFLILDILIRHL
jgi:CheY-like chemotaxis protein